MSVSDLKSKVRTLIDRILWKYAVLSVAVKILLKIRGSTTEIPSFIYNISDSAFALYADNGKENAQTMNHRLCHRFTLRINKQYFISLKLCFGILVNIF